MELLLLSMRQLLSDPREELKQVSMGLVTSWVHSCV